MSGAIAILLAVAASGCVGGSRSGSDQPSLPGLERETAPVEPAQKESINESSEDDVAAALRRGDVDDPQGWARILIGYRPYPPGAPGQERIRQVLAEHDADPAEIDKILAVVGP